MKKTIITMTSAVAVLATLGLGTAHAADLSTQAEFNVTNGKLTLDEAPHLNFGTTSIEKLVKGEKTLKLDSNAKNAGTDTTGTNQIKVTNYDANAKEWVVSAKAGDFKNGNDVLAGATIKLAPATAVHDDDKAATVTANQVSITGNSADVLTGSALGVTTSAVSGADNATLDLTNVDNHDVKGDASYVADIDWTLTNTAAAPSASSVK